MMSKKELIYYDIFNKCQLHDMDYLLHNHNKYIDIITDITDLLFVKKVKIKQWQAYLEVQLFKFTLHSLSLAQLYKKTSVKNTTNASRMFVYDISSIFLLKRAQLENYLMLYYLNFQTSNEDEAMFRYLLYELSGLDCRQNFDVKQQEHKKKKEKEKIIIEEIITKIKSNKYFNSLDTKKQNYFLTKRPSKTFGWERLIRESDLKTELFLKSWILHSNYAHSEMLGSIQIRDYAFNEKISHIPLFNALEMSVILACTIIMDLRKNFVTAEHFFDKLPLEDRIKIDYWWKFGKEEPILNN